MKIVHIAQDYNDGYGYQENLLPRYQAKLGHEVSIITSNRKSYFQEQKISRIVGTGEFADNGIRILRLPIKWEFKGRFVKFINLLEILYKEKPDYVFHHGLTSPSLIICATYKKKNLKTFLVADNHAEKENSGRNLIWRYLYYRKYWSKKIKKINKYIDLFFSINLPTKNFMINHLGVDSQKVKMLFLGADVDGFVPSKNARLLIRKKYNIPKNKILIITVGKYEKLKRTELLISAVKKIPNVFLFVVGSGDPLYISFLKKLAISCKRIIFTGWVDYCNLPDYFSASDVAIWPGKQSAIFQNAIGLGLPVMIKWFPGIEYIVDGNGFVLKNDCVDVLVNNIKKVRDDKDLLDKFRKRSIELTDEKLSYKRIAEISLLIDNKNM